MNKEQIILKTIEFVRNKLEGEGSGHDWFHIERVYKTALYIGQKEDCDLFIVELGALLHDIADWKFNENNVNKGAEVSQGFLRKLKVDEEIIEKVCKIVKTISFKGGTVDSTQNTIEGKVVQDADRIDALGAVGIARTFAYGGFKKREIYNPQVKPMKFESFESFKKNDGPTLNHFYEKLLLLKDTINTDTGKILAKKRHDFMELYLEHFLNECNGKDLEL